MEELEFLIMGVCLDVLSTGGHFSLNQHFGVMAVYVIS
jgi:hypothetical protein